MFRRDDSFGFYIWPPRYKEKYNIFAGLSSLLSFSHFINGYYIYIRTKPSTKLELKPYKIKCFLKAEETVRIELTHIVGPTIT